LGEVFYFFCFHGIELMLGSPFLLQIWS
jgi:hypothetical protein